MTVSLSVSPVLSDGWLGVVVLLAREMAESFDQKVVDAIRNAQKPYDVIVIGKDLVDDKEWYRRLRGKIEAVSPNSRFVDVTIPDGNAILRDVQQAVA